jgi:hypothetical protein
VQYVEQYAKDEAKFFKDFAAGRHCSFTISLRTFVNFCARSCSVPKAGGAGRAVPSRLQAYDVQQAALNSIFNGDGD